jgi:hypothetical protein
LRRFLATLATLAVPAALLAILPAQSALAATRTMTGTIEGSDGRAVNVMIAFDVHRRNGTKIDINGGGGYSATISLNKQVPVTGAAKGPGKVTTWSLTMPSDAAYVYIEVYPKSPHASGQPYMQGPTSQYRYGQALRRALPAGSRNVALRLPLKCGFTGGVTGGIKGRVTKGGHLVQPDRVRAWSTATDSPANTKILGWNMGKSYASTGLYQGHYNYVVPNLAPGQGYTVWVTEGGRTITKKVANVATCKGTALNFSF